MIELETKRLILKKYQLKDKENLVELLTDKKIMKHVGDGVMLVSEAEKLWKKTLASNKSERYIWAVFEKEKNRYIGNANLNPRPEKREFWEFGFILKEDFWGKGYATEIGKQIVKFAFEKLNFSELYATVDDDNFVSIRVLEKIGLNFFKHEFDEQGRFSVYAVFND